MKPSLFVTVKSPITGLLHLTTCFKLQQTSRELLTCRQEKNEDSVGCLSSRCDVLLLGPPPFFSPMFPLSLKMGCLWSGVCLEVTVQAVVSKWGRKTHDVKHSSCVSLCLYSCQGWVSCTIKHQCCCLTHRIRTWRKHTHTHVITAICVCLCVTENTPTIMHTPSKKVDKWCCIRTGNWPSL